MRLTKLDMARVIATALFNSSELVKDNNWKVIKLQKTSSKELHEQYIIAKRIIQNKIKEAK